MAFLYGRALRLTAKNFGFRLGQPGEQCISGQTGRKGPPSPPPPPPPGPPSDQRPRFHFQPTLDATNDIQGPFYDPRHQMYHMGFAWHGPGCLGALSRLSALSVFL
jgi:hypothetical protein